MKQSITPRRHARALTRASIDPCRKICHEDDALPGHLAQGRTFTRQRRGGGEFLLLLPQRQPQFVEPVNQLGQAVRPGLFPQSPQMGIDRIKA